jgi:hypothetical protein
MINTTTTVNETVRVFYQGEPGIADVTKVTVINNADVLQLPNVTMLETDVPGVYLITYTPTVTGKALVLFDGVMVAYVEVVSRSIYSFLRNIEDEAIGSWTWDKHLGKLTFIRQDGTLLSTYDVTDSNVAASRERTS